MLDRFKDDDTQRCVLRRYEARQIVSNIMTTIYPNDFIIVHYVGRTYKNAENSYMNAGGKKFVSKQNNVL